MDEIHLLAIGFGSLVLGVFLNVFSECTFVIGFAIFCLTFVLAFREWLPTFLNIFDEKEKRMQTIESQISNIEKKVQQ